MVGHGKKKKNEHKTEVDYGIKIHTYIRTYAKPSKIE